jgi:Holliday junction resolvasome RuvABC DNA-binding subunit
MMSSLDKTKCCNAIQQSNHALLLKTKGLHKKTTTMRRKMKRKSLPPSQPVTYKKKTKRKSLCNDPGKSASH